MRRGFLLFIATVLALSIGEGVVASAQEDGDRVASTTSVMPMRLKVSSNGRYFVDQDGKPFFYLGDTAWLLFQRLDRTEVDDFLRDRADKGFTVIQAYVLRGLEERHPDGPISLLGATPIVDRDPAKPNEAFFENVDYVVNRANELGLVMGLVVAKSWHVHSKAERVFDATNAYVFGKFLGARYKGNAVLWYVGGDSIPGDGREIWIAMARGLREGSVGRHLISYHGSRHTSSSQWFHGEDWLDFNSIQSGHDWEAKTYEFIAKDYRLSPAKPTVDMEPPYENHSPTGQESRRIDSHQVRKGAYWAMLAGAAGHGYGAHDLFFLYKESDGPFPREGFQPWRAAMAYEGSHQVGLVRRLFEQRPWYKLVPDQSVIASGQSAGEEHLQAAKADDGSFLIVYAPTGKPFSIHMDKLFGKEAQAHWYDPRQGTWTAIGRFPNNGVREFVAPSRGEKDDWVLVLDDAAKDYSTEIPSSDYDESQ
ncbi:MAG: glycoside hydrolase family 140 protein [Gemmataceae bacterium]|nr:glycoside hydrolase family 140 protein [Gemmataceae bacterium]